jgi:hypothetical protein
LEIVTTVPLAPPSIIVVLAPEPNTLRFMLMVRFSVYVAGATLIESPETASEMAWPMALQAVAGDKQLLLLLPLTPFTYQVVADAIGTHRAKSHVVVSLCFMITSSPSLT